MNEERITYFAQTDARSKRVKFGIKAKDRTRHVYVIGKTGMGKSTLLENMAVQDIANGEGMAFIDPHGKTADLLLEYIPEHRIKDVIYFAPFDTDYPISFNVLESVDPDKRHLVVSGLMSTFKKIWQDAWSARMEYILTNTLLALLEYPGATLLGVNRMLAEKDFRKDVIDHVTDISVKNFWVKEFANYTERMAAEAVPAIQNKIGQFTANALIRNMIGQAQSSFDIRKMMDERKIMIINLSKGRIGESNANLLGGMLITKIYLAALSRADVPDRVLKGLPNFYLFVDEFQSFANESFADILSEARKYKLNLTIAHQYIEQMEEEVRAAVFGNVGTMIIFRVGAYDAEVLEKEFAPVFTAEDIVNLGFTQIYLKLMIDGISSSPFSATSLPPIKAPEVSHTTEAIAMSRQQFALSRTKVEQAITDWHQPIAKAPRPAASPATPIPAATPVSTSHNITPKPVSSSTAPSVSMSPAHAPAYSPQPQPSQPSRTISQSTPPPSQPQSSSPSFQPHVQQHPSAHPQPHLHPQKHDAPRPTHQAKPVSSTPFKTAFSALEYEEKPVPLTALSPKVPRNDQKTATPKNVGDLKSALASVIGKAAAPSPSLSPSSPLSPSPSPISKPRAAEDSHSSTSPEVPKEVLEQLLKVD